MPTREPPVDNLTLGMLLQHMSHWCVEHSVDLDALLQNAALPFRADDLLSGRILEATPTQYSSFYAAITEHWHEQAVGSPKWGTLEASPSTLQAMGYCALSADTLGEALQRITHFINLFKEHRGSAELMIEGSKASLYLRSLGTDSRTPQPPGYMLAADVNGVVVLHRFSSWLIGELIPLEEIGLVGRKPDRAYLFSLYQLFGCNHVMQQEKNYLRFPAHYLERRIVQHKQGLDQLVENAGYELLSISSTKPSISSQIRTLLSNDNLQDPPSFEEVAERLYLSPTTLRRHLRREHTNFQQIKDECRCDVAARYLKTSTLAIEDIAFRLGFSDANSFRRAFKKWTGLAPSDFREQQDIPTETFVNEGD